MFEIWPPLLSGLVLLVAGGDLLVRGAVQVATRLGVTPLVIGLTLVGFGTSMPELVTSVRAALVDAPGIAFGNIVGSNIANILLILGLSALLFPPTVSSFALRRDCGVMLAATGSFVALAAVAPMGRMIGALFVTALASYLYVAFRQERLPAAGHRNAHQEGIELRVAKRGAKPKRQKDGAITMPLLMAMLGLVMIAFGGLLLVGGAVALAQSAGIPETVIGVTIVAVGTSLPELVTSVVAAIRRQGDVCFGNVVGSNIYNILCIGGTTSLIAPGMIPPAIVRFDNVVMLSASLLLVLFAWTRRTVARWEGASLLVGYALYVFAVWK